MGCNEVKEKPKPKPGTDVDNNTPNNEKKQS